MWENAAVYGPRHSCCARTKDDGCSCLIELSRERNEVLSCHDYSRAEKAEPCSVQYSVLFLALPNNSWGTEMTQKPHWKAKQTKIFLFLFL